MIEQIESIMKIVKASGIEIKNEEDFYKTLEFEIKNNQFKHILNSFGEVIGFYAWVADYGEFGVKIYVTKLFILPEHRKTFTLRRIATDIENRYESVESFSWNNSKRDRKFSTFRIREGVLHGER